MKKLLMIFVFLFVLGCQDQIVELDIPSHTPLLVVNGFLDTDGIISFHVSSSVGAFENESIHSIDDADILLSENNILLPTEIQSNYVNDVVVWHNDEIGTTPIYYYTFDTVPQPSSTYSIEISHPDYETVFSQTTIPKPIDLVEWEIVDNPSQSDNSDIPSSKLNFIIKDQLHENNYYKIRLIWRGERHGEMTDFPLTMHSNDPSLSQGIPWGGYSFIGEDVLFSDDLFNGMEKEFSLDFEYKIESLVNGEEILLQLTSFSEDAYHYFNSMERNRGSFFGPFGTEPSPIFSNIENGIGIFASGRTIFQKVLP